jgi:hypothetical protein
MRLRNCSGIDGLGCRVTWAKRKELGKNRTRRQSLCCMQGRSEMITGECWGKQEANGSFEDIKAQT